MIPDEQLDDLGRVKVGTTFDSSHGVIFAAQANVNDGCDGCAGCVGRGDKFIPCSLLPPCAHRIYVFEDDFLLRRLKGLT